MPSFKKIIILIPRLIISLILFSAIPFSIYFGTPEQSNDVISADGVYTFLENPKNLPES